jgi:hypothetical protein
LAVDPAGQPVVATVSVAAAVPPPTTGNLLQPNHGGGSDVYVAILDAAGTSLVYGSFLGGLLEDRPRAIALHPGGGFVVAGATFSPNFPTTPNPLQASHGGAGYTDGFVCYGDPSAFGSARRYCTYLGGNLGDDSVLALAVETSGRATLAGFTTGGNFPTTPRCHQDSFGNSTELGFVMRLELDGQGPDDLLYSTLLGGSTNVGDLRLNGLVLDDVGDVYVAGASGSVGYPLVNPIQTTPVGREGVFTHLPLLPGGVSRNGVSFARSACAAPLYLGAGSAPVPGATFAITATNAPPNGIGILVIGTPVPPTPLPPPFGCTLLASPTLLFTTLPSARGGDRFDVPVAATQPSVPSWGLAAQWFYFTTPTCPGAGMFACSERLDF